MLEQVRQHDLFDSREESRQITSILAWQGGTTSGLRSELPFEPLSALWGKICRESDLCFGKGWPTDVISQPYTSPPGGEVIVNVERALFVGGPGKQGEAELALYIAHGLHHLAGAVDRTPAQRRAMLRQERAWLRAAAKEGLLADLWRAAGPGRR